MPSPFQERVWKLLSEIPAGKTTTYGEIAKALGKRGAARAVGNACNANPFAPKVPCHRVVASDGKIGGYAHGLKKKIGLLKKEGIRVKNGKIADFDGVFWRFE